jgi:hypothetical protein
VTTRLRSVVGAAVIAAAAGAAAQTAGAQPARLEYRVVHAAPRELQRRIDEAGREGFECVSVARPEPDVRLNGLVVILARPWMATTQVTPRIPHRVLLGGGGGGDLGALLERGAADGYRLCGVALVEIPPAPILVAVMSPDTERERGSRHYAAEVLGTRERLARLAAKGREGFVPVAAAPVNDNLLPEQRNFFVVVEQTGTQPIDIAIRSGPGPDSLEKSIVEQSKQGFICSLMWKEGLTSIVVVMSRLPVDPTRRPEFDVDTIDPSRLDGLSGVYIGDVPYLSDGQRVVLTIKEMSSTTYAVADPLPLMGSLDYASLNDMRPLGEHLARDRSRDSARVTFSSVRRGPRGGLVLHTVLTRFSR